MSGMRKLLSGNEALALGAYHAGVKVAAAYPGTPSTEILETIAHFDDVYAEWSTNEKVAMEVALGASYTGVRAMASMKQVGLNVASDPFMAASTTGVDGGLVVICADDPGAHSSQGEQDNRHYARLAKVPMLEPSDSQEAYDFMAQAFDLSEQFDTPVMVRTTTRISHSKTVVDVRRSRTLPEGRPEFKYNVAKYVMLPAHARIRHPLMEERLVKLAEYAETCPLNRIIWNAHELGVVTSGVAYQYAREIFPKASFLKLGMTYPLPHNLLQHFASQVKRLIVVEELEPFLQENMQAMGIEVTGKEFIPRVGELNPDIIYEAGQKMGLLPDSPRRKVETSIELPRRPPERARHHHPQVRGERHEARQPRRAHRQPERFRHGGRSHDAGAPLATRTRDASSAPAPSASPRAAWTAAGSISRRSGPVQGRSRQHTAAHAAGGLPVEEPS